MKRLLILLFGLMLLSAHALGEGEMILSDGPDDTELEEYVETARELKYGDEGDDVTELQQRLTDLCYYSGNISGRYREGTREAVKEFQKDFGLEATGEADAHTQALLFATQYRPLERGDEGEDVKRLQTRLNELGYYNGKISGKFLEGTEYAINLFQEINGEDPTGKADPETQQVLYADTALHRNAPPTPTPAPEDDFLVIDEDENGQPVFTPAPPQPTHVPYTKRLARGSTGALVKQLQQRLTDMGYYEGPVSGNLLGHTVNAIKALQKQNAIEADGIVGEDTWNLIFNDPDVVLPHHTPKPTPAPTPVPYAITVDVTNQVTTVYGRDENGEFTVVVREMLCSTGTKANPSDPGDWVLNGRRAKWCYFPKWGGHARYWTRINSSIAFHSVIYNTVNTMDLSISSYKNLGKRASHGCIRLTVADAKWIYDNIGEGVVVSIVEGLPADPELRASLKLPELNKKNMLPYETPQPTASPVYISGGTPPLPLEKLQTNDSSEAVYWLQMKLKELGYYNGKCSGTYLKGTANAVKAFQKANNIYPNGIATVKTLEKLYELELATPTPAPTPTATPEPIPEPQ
ncbi:MAG: peptidoglycan-binding protein [Clostridia bacterium]|nr:peptidoglycan-binding protein [Clostridia bacterium]